MKKGKKIIGALSATALLLSMSVNAFAVEANETTNIHEETKIQVPATDKNNVQNPVPTIEEKQKIESKVDAFTKLTPAQKKEVYKLYENILNDKKKLIDKYVELKLIEKPKGDAMKLHMEEAFKKAKEKNMMPGMWMWRDGKAKCDTPQTHEQKTPAPEQD